MAVCCMKGFHIKYLWYAFGCHKPGYWHSQTEWRLLESDTPSNTSKEETYNCIGSDTAIDDTPRLLSHLKIEITLTNCP